MHFQLEIDINIQASSDAIYALIANLKRWPDWSPWSVGRNDKVVFSWGDDGKSYQWEDEVIGKGSMVKIKDTPSALSFAIAFEKPYKSKATTSFLIEQISDRSCKVTWKMDGNVPWFLFFLIPSIKGAISLDYWNGLNMLKHLAEDGGFTANYSDISSEDYEKMYIVGKMLKKCPLYAVASSQPDFKTLEESIHAYGETIAPINVYENFDIKTHLFDFTGGYTVTKETFTAMKEAQKDGFDYLTLDAGKAMKLQYSGDYLFIGNAWSILGRYMRFKKQKNHPSLSGFEIYRKHPLNEKDKNRYETDVYMALKV